MKKLSPRVSSTAFCALVGIDGWAVLESNLQPNFQDDRDVRKWSKRAACKHKQVGSLIYQQPPSMNICKPSERSLLQGLRGQ